MAARLAAWIASTDHMHVNISWLRVEERFTASVLVFVRGIDMLKSPSCLFKQLAHSSDTYIYPTRDATRSFFTDPKSRTNYRNRKVLHRAMTTWNFISHHVTQSSSKISTAQTVMRQTHTGTHTAFSNTCYHTCTYILNCYFAVLLILHYGYVMVKWCEIICCIMYCFIAANVLKKNILQYRCAKL